MKDAVDPTYWFAAKRENKAGESVESSQSSRNLDHPLLTVQEHKCLGLCFGTEYLRRRTRS